MKELNYEVLGWALKALSEKCFEAARQQKQGESVTACGMDDDDLGRLCEIIPEMMNPMMTFGQGFNRTFMDLKFRVFPKTTIIREF